MRKKVAGGSPRAVKNSRGDTPEQPKPRAQRNAPRSTNRTSAETPQQQPLALSDSAEVENIRRANLRLLTSRNGSKVRLGVVMEMSGFNIADRLNGKKRMDGVETNRFTERLGLPVGWLDSPRTEAEIPESVSHMLTPAPRGRAPVQQQASPAPATNDGVQGKLVDGKVRARRKRATALEASVSPAPVSADVAEDGESIVESPRADVNHSPDDLASRSFDENHEAVPVATSAPDGSMPESLSVPVAAPQSPALLAVSSVTSLDNLHGLAPIAEALIKTLAGKARTGRLDELKALELLQQAVLL
ncbi:MAG TPA: hypothetical protein VJU59_43670 [Paraburkholderia sp.]|uniref:hypothetical protein n=1 Tax=Paraburkholderia sp. TaxID=1926495 RepID=UPI002B484A79|nr:hypothetical protein [Paraburkholderia sp.]HKR46493.1 hypothetical protein [Paraburkholderia sp.]